MSNQSADQPNFNIDSMFFLKALSPAILTHCAEANKNFYNCKRVKGENPEACLPEAVDVRRCVFKLGEDVLDEKSGCQKLFLPYLQCMHRKRGEWARCYDERVAFEACAAKNMGIEFRAPVKPSVE